MWSAATLFRVVYTTFYFLLYLVLLVLLIVSPADIIIRSLSEGVSVSQATFFIAVVSVAYFVTTSIVVFVYSTRLYINRSVLASIPKPWIPVEKGDVRSTVRKVIAASLSRSAAIAFDARPRVLPPNHGMAMMAGAGVVGSAAAFAAPLDGGEDSRHLQPVLEQTESAVDVAQAPAGGQRDSKDDKRMLDLFHLKKTPTVEDELGINLPPHKPIWGGDIEHSGWGSPLSADFPNLQYSTVIAELPNLLEAKALTLAPTDQPDVASPSSASTAPPTMLDPEAVAALQRGNLSLRDYLANLATLGVLQPSSHTVAEFLAAYEHARFSTRPPSARRFRELMHLFAEVLRLMVPLDPVVLYCTDTEVDADDFYDEDDEDFVAASTDGEVPRPRPRPGPGNYSSDIDNDRPAAASSTTTTNPEDEDSGSFRRERAPRMPTRGTSPVGSVATTSTSDSNGSDVSQIRHPRRRRRRTLVGNRAGGGVVGTASGTAAAAPARPRNSSAHTWQQQFQTAPTTPKSRRTATAAGTVTPSSAHGGGGSVESFSQSRHPYPISQASTGSLSSLASSGSVVRLRDR